MTQSPHMFTNEELVLIAHGSIKYNKDWRKIQTKMLPHLNHISIKNKYYKMMHNGMLDRILKNQQLDDESRSDDRIIGILCTLGATVNDFD
uniref:Myb-like DNA-binding domain-containing protein n=1 Tax=Trepomonas sp. PC1 TaxID=1076344 RepID=A0A146KES5_9EUKA|eukprot:JAP95223.1 Hypothetical protein TPC1_11860 [Trepomonas sp. PC1]